ncbi:FadR/GntR family transcriptional regulator [Salinicola sp. RZ23]|uniref:FadR/GntR family transcriptional regulator n=1 Tax=Salinicola sp. RZ23 TaxID=1949087 RepID=UPI000DA13A32|nr:FadR/GntR family transcriptional regulator [Salinicola sp. RZ23]
MPNPAFAHEKTLQSKTKKALLADKLIDMILTGLLRDGDELPGERALSQLFGVSRETVRGAMARLEAVGLIAVAHGSKTRIVAGEAELARFRDAAPAQRAGEFDPLDLDSVFESRAVVEAAIARLAARHIDAEGVALLRRLLEAQRELFASPVHFQLSDQRFHKLISAQARNPILARYAEELYAFGLPLRRQVMNEPAAIAQSYREHGAIVAALAEGDPEAAERAMLTHLESVHRTTREQLSGRRD